MLSQTACRLLAMPAAFRAVFLAPSRHFHATQIQAGNRPMRKPLTVGAFTLPHSPNLPIIDVPLSRLLESPNPDKPLPDQLCHLFTRNPATFYHGTSSFYSLKKNTRVPEVCVLGRSNVGKSTFVNALANRRENELAHTSARAGKTKAMNAYGFGPAPTMKELSDTSKEIKRTEDLPKHSLYVVDMPGYGHNSLKDWGKHINLYLHKRSIVKGAVILIDGEIGPKNTDLMALELLRDAGVKTLVVLTKADKAHHVDVLRQTCQQMWSAIREIQSEDLNKPWNWEREIFVTAAGATKKEIGAGTTNVARLAVARLAGLVHEKNRPESEGKGYSGKIVAFDDIIYAPSIASSHHTAAFKSAMSSSSDGSISSFDGDLYELTALECAAKDHGFQEMGNTADASALRPSSATSSSMHYVQTRSFHTGSARVSSELTSRPSEFLHSEVASFMEELKALSATYEGVKAASTVQDRESAEEALRSIQHHWGAVMARSLEVARLAKDLSLQNISHPTAVPRVFLSELHDIHEAPRAEERQAEERTRKDSREYPRNKAEREARGTEDEDAQLISKFAGAR